MIPQCGLDGTQSPAFEQALLPDRRVGSFVSTDSRLSLIKRREAASTWRVREGRIPWVLFSPCASFRDRVLRLCSIRDGINRGNRQRHAAVAAAAARCRPYIRDGGRASRKNFPEGPIPTIRVGASYVCAFGGRTYRSVAAATYVHPAHNARCKVHVQAYAWKATGKSEPGSNARSSLHDDARSMRRDESERSWESKLRGACLIACQKWKSELRDSEKLKFWYHQLFSPADVN